MFIHWLDFSITAIILFVLILIAFLTRQYTKSVADFMVGGRCAGRYLTCVAIGATGLGAVTILGRWEVYYHAGFTASWWLIPTWAVMLIVGLSGWITYRYRETRVMTMPQFFEMRYSRRFRVFFGILAFLAGVVNMGIFPAVTARFFIFFFGLPETFEFIGLKVSMFATIMILELIFALILVFSGGMIVVMITDFFQGIFGYIVFMILIVVVFYYFDWGQIMTAAKTAPENASLLNPYKTTEISGFDLWYFLITIFLTVYGLGAWQGASGYRGANKNAHESKMAGIIAMWRNMITLLLMMMTPIAVYTLLNHSDFSDMAIEINGIANAISDDVLRSQAMVPIGIGQILPVGVLGLLSAAMLCSAISTDTTYLHSWGTMFIQDIVMPFRNKKIPPEKHLLILRFSIVFVAVFVFFFSLLFKQTDHIMMFIRLTGAIVIGGAGSVVVGGLYWKRGTTGAAWSALIVGAILSASGLLLQQEAIWSKVVLYLNNLLPNSQFLINNPDKFPFDGVRMSFVASLVSIAVYIGVSLYSWLILGKKPFNMNRMLHRGEYAIKSEHSGGVTLPPTGLRALLPSKEFTKGDKFLYYILVAWILGWFVFFLCVTAYHFTIGTSDEWWGRFWYYFVFFGVLIGIITLFWLTIGGIIDLKDFFNQLKIMKRDDSDDGSVDNNYSNDD